MSEQTYTKDEIAAACICAEIAPTIVDKFYSVLDKLANRRSPAQSAPATDYPECSGDPAGCPENEGYGCCKPNPSTPASEPFSEQVKAAQAETATWPDSVHAAAHCPGLTNKSAPAAQEAAVRICPERDVACGDFPKAWCPDCPKKPAAPAAAQEAHKIMTRQEYDALNLDAWHRVCHSYDSAGNTAIMYGSGTIVWDRPKSAPPERNAALERPDWAEDAASVIIKLKDQLAERGARPTASDKAALWDEACDVYQRMVVWANSAPPERDALDARRWRWWRDRFGRIVVNAEWDRNAGRKVVTEIGVNIDFSEADPESLDTATDAAMQQEGGN